MIREKSCGAVVYKNESTVKFLVEYMKQGHISLPKGHVENNETEVETAFREIKEETSLDVNIDTNFREVISYSPKDGVIKDVVFFIAKVKSFNEPKDNHDDEVKELKFLSFEEAYSLLTYHDDKKVLKKAYEYLMKLNKY